MTTAGLKVLAAMSGGVDSAVAAGRAVDAGHDVTGVHMALAAKPATLRHGARGCCTVEDAHDARRSADVLGIPFYVWDLAERFRVDVVDDFVAEYAAGRTPNPCVRCNEKIKFAAVLDRALALGFDAVVTGHHARLVDGRLMRSVDARKDQSYVLAVLTQAQLRHAMFPLGESTKDEVRDEAARRGLAVARKPDSHDICFIPDGDTRSFLRRSLGARSGPIVDVRTGAEVGRHDGAFGYTVGQRRGLGLTQVAPDGQSRYVVSVQTDTNTVFVGSSEQLETEVVHGRQPVWTAGRPPDHSFDAEVQLRAHGMVSRARITVAGDEVTAVLTGPQRGVAPGQALVIYDGEMVLGSATISATRAAAVT